MNQKIDKKDWDNWLDVKGLSKRTKNEYNSYFDKIDINNINQESTIEFIQKYNNIVARAFLKNLTLYMKMKGHNPNIDIPRVTGRRKKRIPDILTETQIIDFSNDMKNERSQLMVLICFYGGLRISELVVVEDNEEYAIRPYSFNWNTWIKEPDKIGVLKIIGKGNKQRTVFIPQFLMRKLYQYIRENVSQKQSKDEPLFNICERRWRKILADESNRLLGRHINPHLLRHSCNQWLRTKGWDVTERQKYMGHDNPQTTMKYDHTNPKDIKEKFEQLF